MKYTIRNKKTRKTKSLEIPISEVDQWEAGNQDWEIVIGAPLIHSGIGLGLKSAQTEEVFRDKVRETAKKNPRNTLNNYVKF